MSTSQTCAFFSEIISSDYVEITKDESPFIIENDSCVAIYYFKNGSRYAIFEDRCGNYVIYDDRDTDDKIIATVTRRLYRTCVRNPKVNRGINT